jgi:hypothetical protein
MKESLSDTKHEAFWVGLFGLYLMVGAAYSFVTAKWFPGFPPQLDIFSLPGSVLGAYIEATAATLIGVGCLYVASVLRRKPVS